MTAKFQVPGTQPWTIVRQRLLDRVSLGVGGPLTLVTAPAGSGKTMLASSWATAGLAPGPVVWISLDEQDGQQGVLWSYIVAGLGRAGVPVAHVGMPTRPDSVERSLLVRLAAGLSEQPRPVVLILEDAHVLRGPQALESIDFVLRHSGPQLRLLVLSRVDPEMPLHRYRVAGSMVEIRLDELAFTVPEAQQLFSAHAIDLPEPALTDLVERTKGWAAGLRLAARSQRDRTAVGRPVDGADISGDVEDYFVAEVLNAQSSGTRDFLLRTSVVDQMWPGLAAELSGRRDALRTLTTLAHTNTFVTPNAGDLHSYEYHPIVRDLLRSQLRHEAPNKVVQLHRKAAHWLADAGRVTDALAHAAAAGDWERAAAMVVDNLAIDRLIASPQAGRLAGTLTGMPPDLADPAVAVVHAALALSRRDPGQCAKHLLRAAELVGGGSADGGGTLHLSAAVVDVVCAGLRGDVDVALTAAATAETAIADLADQGRPVPAPLPALVLLNKGRALLRRGDLDSAAAALTAGLSAAEAGGAEHLRPEVLGQLALTEALCGRVRRATERALQAGAAAEGPQAVTAQRSAAADVALAWARVEEYDLRSARGYADRAAEATEIQSDPVAAGLLAVVRARLMRTRGDAAGAVATIQRARAAVPGSMPGWLHERLWAVEATSRAASGAPESAAGALPDPDAASTHVLLAHATIRLARDATGEAAELVSRVLARSDLAVDVGVDAWLLAATCELIRGRTERARSALSHGLALAETEKLRRPVVEASQRLRRFLRQERELADKHRWLEPTAVGSPDPRARPGAAGSGAVRTSAPVVEALTVKESEVLRYLAALLSTEEIALKMFVSVNTVKTHVRGVLRKLAASRRNEAIRRARELGLL